MSEEKHSQNGEGVEVLRDSANSHCFDDRIMVAGECIAFASEPWSSKIAASLAREPATADVGREGYWKALEQAARDLGGAGVHLIGKRQSNMWLDIAFKAHTALSRAAPSSEPAIAEGELAGIMACMDEMLADPKLDALAFDKHDSRIIRAALAALPSKDATIAEAVERMRADPFIDDAHLLGTTSQDQRMQHYAAIALATTPPTTNDAIPAGEQIEKAARYVLDNSRRGNASLNSDQYDADTQKLMTAYRDIIGKALASGFLSAAPSAPATEAGS